MKLHKKTESKLVKERLGEYLILRKASADGMSGIFRALIRRFSPDVPARERGADAENERSRERPVSMNSPGEPILVRADDDSGETCVVRMIHDGRCRCWLVEYRDKRYVLKLDKRDRHRFDYLAQSFFFGSNAFRLMRALNKAFSRGFRGAPELFCVADSRRFGCTRHSFFFKEYAEGEPCSTFPREVRDALCEKVRHIIATLHACGVTHGDAHPGNFIFEVKSGVLKAIDIGGKMPTPVQKATDRLRLQKEWGIPNECFDWGWVLARLHIMRRRFGAFVRGGGVRNKRPRERDFFAA